MNDGRRANNVDTPGLSVGPACLLFFIDETGHENFADPQYPVFGLGGCAVVSSAVANTVTNPWRAMKGAYFGGEAIPLHASKLRNPTATQIAALSTFFREQRFARFAVTMSKSAALSTGLTPFEVVAGSIMNRMKDLLSRVVPEPNEVALLHEASDRCDRLVEKHFGGATIQINGKTIPVHKGLVAKSHGLPELEVADFVMHAAGRRALQIHRTVPDPTTRFGKDFEAVFHSDPVLCSYIHIERALTG